MSVNKRTRSINWSDEEKEVLKMLVLEGANILKNKDTSNNTNISKKVASENVLSRKRDLSQHLNQWRNMKNVAKKSEVANTATSTMTSGRPLPPNLHPSEDHKQIEAIDHEFIKDDNCHDSVTLFIKQKESTEKLSTYPSFSPLPKELKPGKPQSIDPLIPAMQQAKPVHPLQNRPGPSGSAPAKKQEMNKSKSGCCSTSHKHMIFMMIRRARRKVMLQDKEFHECRMMQRRELHERRMAIMALEEEYWKRKIKKLTI